MSETVNVIWAIQHQYKTRPFECWFTMAHCNLKTEEQAKEALASCRKNKWMRDLNHRIVKITSITEVADE